MLFQAAILARYKPTINAKLLIPNLREVEEMVTKSLEYFKSTRHIILYYEDIIKNHAVRQSQSMITAMKKHMHIHSVSTHTHKLLFSFGFPETDRSPRFSQGSTHRSK